VFPVSDGHIIIASGNDRQYRDLCRILDLPELAGDPRFIDNGARVANRDVLIPLLSEATARRTAEDLLAALEQAKVPGGPINGLAAVFADPQIKARGMEIELPFDGGTVPGLRTPIMTNDETMASERPAPRLGEHTDEILAELEKQRDKT
jgi:crotonobetainyl-CoA:carnitine CoA-transferase CaiB-like acyl-CoA transferase